MLCKHLEICPSQSLSRANANGVYGSDLQSGSFNIMVCRHGSCPGEVCICVDFKFLNENVLREVHPLSKVETTLLQLSGATVFSKIDTNSGFWQILLDTESWLLTKFLGDTALTSFPLGFLAHQSILKGA